MYFGFNEIAKRIKDNPGKYRSIEFDGCSCLPDEILGYLIGDKWRKVLRCCMKHDLKYIYGISGDKNARFRADIELKNDLIQEARVSFWIAAKFFYSVGN